MNLPKRKLQRLKDYDYSQNGAYFITICTHKKENLFGKIVDGQMVFNAYGRIVHEIYSDLPNHNQNMKSDKFIIMPNHIHGIIVIDNCSNRLITVQKKEENAKINGIPEMVRQLKTFSSKYINEFQKRNGS